MLDRELANAWLNSLPVDQRDAVIAFFGGSGDDQLHRVMTRQFPRGMRRATLADYLKHVIEPSLQNGRDFGTVMIKGSQRPTQAFRKELVALALPHLH